MIAFRDFKPPAGIHLTQSQRDQAHRDAVDEANDWIVQDDVKVINVETSYYGFVRVSYQVEGHSPRTTLPKPSTGTP